MNNDVRDKLNNYPKSVETYLLKIRSLIFEIARQENLGEVEESLKWNEPSYFVKGCSRVRFDWKPESPQQCFLFFNCKTKLVETFREIYSDTLTFQNNRAIILNIDEPLPVDTIQHCIEVSLKYKSLKNLPLLGM